MKCDNHTHRPMFKELKLSGEKHIILDYEIEHIVHILGQADEVHFMGDYQSFVITNLVSEWRNILLILPTRKTLGMREISPTLLLR